MKLKNYLGFVYIFFLSLFSFLCIYIVVTLFFVDCISVSSSNLEPIVQKKSKLFVLKTTLQPRIKDGDLVLFYHKYNKKPSILNYLLSFLTFNILSKYKNASLGKVVGISGDEIDFDDGKLYRIKDEKRILVKSFDKNFKTLFSVNKNFKLRKDEFFIISQKDSINSIFEGVYFKKNIDAKVLFRYFPLKEYGLIKSNL